MLEKIKKTIDRGVVAAGVQSTTYLESGKLRSKIDHVEAAIQQAKAEMGTTVYANWKSGAENAAYIEGMCAGIRDLELEIEGYQAQIAALQAEKERVLNGGASSAGEGVRCSCGQLNGAEAKFCAGCGKPIEAPPQPKKHFCGSCGAEVTAPAQFCPNCGAKQSEGE